MVSKIESRFVDVAGRQTQLAVGGSGPPLLYLHSAGGETDWMPFHQRLAEKFTVYLPAHPGFADSAGLDQINDMHDLARHYDELLEVLELKSVPMVGFSLGGWLGVELAISYPQRVQRLMLVNAAGLHIDGAPMGELFVSDLEKIKNLIFFDPQAPVVNVAMPTSLDDPRIPLWIRARKATQKIGGKPYLHDPQLASRLDRVQCPTRILWGREDRLIPLTHGQYFAEHIPQATLKIFA
ncbi:MAG: alpha/beta fold hydrolase, partial [Planctomycetales bacterium]|nr:alpha/beta fold hydrolase [Planctomycetales bacterium]NIM10288.1 alpha/beta fold hydrolase [Planctomycetales bacterium]NIN78852.1 alpha/beta fold hydrolase [Planctomycetales bacterium]NIO36019.1 alpha/beta fold hydrolase [Planctomycetales bacterium]